MAKMKTQFSLEEVKGGSIVPSQSQIWIVGKAADNNKPYVSMSVTSLTQFFIPDKDLERFAVNILKALKSKKLKQNP